MDTKGIRIRKIENGVLTTKLSDILSQISNGDSYSWTILFLGGMPKKNCVTEVVKTEKEIQASPDGIRVTWEELNALCGKYEQIFEVIILGGKDTSLLKRYKEEKEMYCACEIVLELVDCAFWEVYAKDEKIIDFLTQKFKDVEILDI